jgi:catechol-2,3-dioxygenase
MQIIGFAHYNLRAPRQLLDELLLFYTQVIGLVQGERPPFSRSGYWLYAGTQDVLHLTEASANEERSTHASTTFDHASFNCTGRRAFEEKLLSYGVVYETSWVPQTGSVQLFLKDPACNGVELVFAATDLQASNMDPESEQTSIHFEAATDSKIVL